MEKQWGENGRRQRERVLLGKAAFSSFTSAVFGTSDRSKEMVIYHARGRDQTSDGGELRGASTSQTCATSASATAADTTVLLLTLLLLLIVVVLFAVAEILSNCRRAARVRAACYELGALPLRGL